MSSSVTSAGLTRRDSSPVIPRPKPAKADLHSQQPTGVLSPLVNESIRESHGKQEVAAQSIGKDPGNFNRDLKKWTETMEALGPEFLAALGDRLVKAFGPLAASPAECVRAKAKELHAIADEFEQLATYIEAA